MTVRITREERDGIQAQVLDRLSGIDDVHQAAVAEDFATAERLGREFADDLLLMADLGWGDPPAGEGVELTLPPGQLHRIFSRLRADAEALRRDEEREKAAAEAEASEFRNRTERVAAASTRVLGIVARKPPSPSGD